MTTLSITTVIPTYRRPQLLKRAVRSALAQTYPDFQVCVYDNASGDETREVVEELARQDDRVKYYCHDRNLGMLKNFIFGLSRVESPFFNILSDDDFLTPGFFAAAVKTSTSSSAFAFVGRELCWDTSEPDRTKVYYDLGRVGLFEPPEAAVQLLARDQIHTWTSIMFRREILDSVGNVATGLPWSEDLDFILRVMARHQVVLGDEICAVYCFHPDQISAEKYFYSYVAGVPLILDRMQHDTSLSPATRSAICAALRASFRRKVLAGALAGVALDQREKLQKAGENLGSDRLSILVRAAAAVSRVPFFPQALRAIRRARTHVRKDPNCDAYLASIHGWLERLDPA